MDVVLDHVCKVRDVLLDQVCMDVVLDQVQGLKQKKILSLNFFVCVGGGGVSCPVAWTHSQGQKNKQTNKHLEMNDCRLW